MPGRQLFSHNIPPINKPFAIGEDGWQMPMHGPSCSGEEALASLIGYYPKRRMDSILNPHTFKSAAAAMRMQFATVKVAAMQRSPSGFIQGFLKKCAEAKLSHCAIMELAQQAIETHPAIAAEFKTVGVEKKAFGSTNGVPIPGISPPGAKMPGQTGAGPHLPTTAGAPPSPPPTPAATMRPPMQQSAPPLSSPSRASLMTGHMPTPAPTQQPPTLTHQPSPFDMPATPNPGNVRPAGPQGYKPPPQRNVLGQGMMNAGNVLAGGTTSLAGGLGTLGGGLGMLGGRVTDGLGLTQGWADGADKFTGNMMDAVHSGVATGYGGLTNQDPQQVAWNMRQGGFANAKPLDQMRQDHLRQLNDSEGLGPLSGSQAGGAYNLLNGVSDTAGQMAAAGGAGGTGAFGKGLMAIPAMMGTPGQVPGALTNAMFDAPTMSQIPGQMIQNMPDYQQGATHPDQVTGFSPNGEGIAAHMQNGNAVPIDQVGANGRGPATLLDGRQPLPDNSGISQMPEYGDIANFAKQAPEQAMQMAQQAMSQLKERFAAPGGSEELNTVAKTGQLTPNGKMQAATALTSQGYDMKQAAGILGNMNGWEQLGLWGGLGLAGVGLLHAMSGGGGMASIIMALLGLGTAGFTAGRAGLLDQGSKDLTNGLAQMMPGQGQKQQPPSPVMDTMMKSIKPMLPTILDHATPEMSAPLLRQFASMSPDIAQQLDQAAGVGSWGNQAMGMLGGLTGMRQNKMQQQLGLDSPHQEKLLELWRNARAQPR